MAKKSAGTRVPVMVDESIYNLFKKEADESGASVSYLIREALGDWAETVLAARTEYRAEKKGAKVVSINRNGFRAVDTELAELLLASEPHPA